MKAAWWLCSNRSQTGFQSCDKPKRTTQNPAQDLNRMLHLSKSPISASYKYFSHATGIFSTYSQTRQPSCHQKHLINRYLKYIQDFVMKFHKIFNCFSVTTLGLSWLTKVGIRAPYRHIRKYNNSDKKKILQKIIFPEHYMLSLVFPALIPICARMYK